MKLEEAIERLKEDVKYADLRDIVDDDCTICFTEDIEAVLHHIEHLQKENEQLQTEVNSLEKHLKDAQEGWTTLYMKGAFDKNEHWRDKIREKIEEIKNKKAEDMFITSTESKLNTIFALEDLLKEE